MLAIGSAMVCKPELLLVDELSLGLAPVRGRGAWRGLQAIRRELGMTVLLVEQNARVALDVADYGYVMENGRVVLDGPPSGLLGRRGDPRVLSGPGARRASGAAIATLRQYRRSRRWYG